MATSDTPSHHHQVKFASALSVMVAATLVIAKVAVLWASGSLSILASLTDSGLDLLASFLTFLAVRFARTPPDKEHSFGHGKAEAFSALFQAGLVFASGALIMEGAIHDLMHPKAIHKSAWAIGVLVLSIVLTFVLVNVQNQTLAAGQSVAVSADRTHYLTDLVSNIIAIIGVGLAALGFGFMDAVGGFLMAAWFIWGAIQVMREAADHLMDHSLPPEDVARICAIVNEDAAILGVHEVRTREAGPWIIIQMHVEMNPDLTLDEAHRIIIAAERRLLDVYPNADIIIHPDPKGVAEPHSGVFQEIHPGEETTAFDLSAQPKA